jgi:hypothetical protein
MRFRGRFIDPVGLWSRYVVFPEKFDPDDNFLPKVQCPNPDHDTLKKHFQVNIAQPTVHCFAYCGISGSYEHAICVLEGIYDRVGVNVEASQAALMKRPSERSQTDKRNIHLYFHAHKQAKKIILQYQRTKTLADSKVRKKSEISRVPVPLKSSELEYETFLPPEALEFLESRRITPSSIAKWSIGWLPEEQRIAIPAVDLREKTQFLVKRSVTGQEPKYLYSAGYPKTSLLFGACRIDPGMLRSVGLALVEGSIDTIVMHQNGLPIAGGILGTGISDAQVAIIARLRPRRIFHFFDRDTAGVKNIQMAAPKLRKYPQFVCRYPRGKYDPAELTEGEAQRMIQRAVPLFQFQRLNVKTTGRTAVGYQQ